MYRLKSVKLLLLIIVILGIILRTWKITQYPVQLNHDEVSQVYDAISIAQTGKDIYGNFLPTIFPSVNDFKSPFYTYSTSLIYLLVGNHEWLIKVTGILFGVLIIPAVFLFTRKLFNSSKVALFSAFFTAISPAEIFFSRKSFENGAGVFFVMMAAFFILKYLEKQQKRIWLILAIIFSSFGMYTYFSHAIIIPLMLISFILIFKNNISFKKHLWAFLLWIILIIPLFLIIWTNPDARFRSQTVFISQDRQLGEQISLIDYSNAFSKIAETKTFIDFSFNRYLEQFDPKFLFATGLDLTNQGILNSGPLLLLQLPLILIAIFFLSQKRELSLASKLLISWMVLGIIPSGLTFEPHSPHRMVIVFTLFNILSGIGMFWLWQKIKTFSKSFKLISILLIKAALILNVIFFLHIYFVNYPYEKSQYIQYPFEQVAVFAWSEHENFNSIVFDPYFGEEAPFVGTAAHYYLAYFGNYSPKLFQEQYRQGSKEREDIFDKFSIRKVDWRFDQDLKNTLIIGSSWSIPIDRIEKEKIIKIFYFYNKRPAFYAIKL